METVSEDSVVTYAISLPLHIDGDPSAPSKPHSSKLSSKLHHLSAVGAAITAAVGLSSRRMPAGAHPHGLGKWSSVRAAHSTKAVMGGLQLESKARVNAERDAKFDWDAQTGDTLCLQGDQELHTKEAWQARLRLRKAPSVVEALHAWWMVVYKSFIGPRLRQAAGPSTSSAEIPQLLRSEYIALHLRLYRTLVVDSPFDEEDARRCAEEGWAQDMLAAGAATDGGMDRSIFMDSMFEVRHLLPQSSAVASGRCQLSTCPLQWVLSSPQLCVSPLTCHPSYRPWPGWCALAGAGRVDARYERGRVRGVWRLATQACRQR